MGCVRGVGHAGSANPLAISLDRSVGNVSSAVDEGSGFWIGMEGLKASFRAHDGRGEPTELLPVLLSSLNAETPRDIVEMIQESDISVKEIAGLSRVVISVAESGDVLPYPLWIGQDGA